MPAGLSHLLAAADGLGVAARDAAGEVSAHEALAAGLERIRKIDGHCGAIARWLCPQALAVGPFTGIPMVVKDLMANCIGDPTTAGAHFFAREPGATADSAAVARMRAAGFGVVGRTKTSEFGLAPTTEPAASGPVRNPWDMSYSPGGSSGGAAALVATRAVPLAHATDGGGSIRIPAALCGLFGLKPSRGRISLAPLGETLAGAGTQLCVSVSVRDSAAFLDVLSGGEPGDPYGAPIAGPFRSATERDPERLRIALQRRPVGGPDVDPVLVEAVEDAARLLESLGHIVEDARPDYEAELLDEAFFTIMAANLWANLSGRAGGRPFGEADVEPVSWAYATAGRDVSAEAYVRAVQTFHRTGRRLGALFERHDVLLSPTLARASLPLGVVRTDGALVVFRAQMAPLIAFTMVHNAAGTPAASVPLAWTADGMPLGVQIAARFGGEATLLALAAQLERARPWRQRRPPLAA